MESYWNLNGKYALITGGTKGIGKATAEMLAELGAHVIVVARTQKDLEKQIDDWKSSDKLIQGICADLSKPDEAYRVFDEYCQVVTERRLDILVNNVGLPLRKAVSDIKPVDYQENLQINVGSMLQMSQAFFPLLKQAKNASIINTSSVNAYRTTPDDVIDGAARSAVVSLTKSLAKAWADEGIRVNSVAPGYTDTQRVHAFHTKEELATHINKIPLKRMASSREIASTIAFLAMNAASYITGQCVIVDGGLTL